MHLVREKELLPIGAAIGCNCRPCIEHHIPAGRAGGLSEAELADALATARGLRDEATKLLALRIDELLTGGRVRSTPILNCAEVGAAVRAAEHVQRRASEMTPRPQSTRSMSSTPPLAGGKELTRRCRHEPRTNDSVG